MQDFSGDDSLSARARAADGEVRSLLRELGWLKFSRRAAAARLSAIGAPAIPAIKGAMRRDEIVVRGCNVALYAFVLLMGFTWTNIYLKDGWSGLSLDRTLPDLLIALGLAGASAIVARRRPFLATALAGIEDPTAIRPLVEGLGVSGFWDTEMRYSVIRALSGSIAKIEPSSGVTLSDRQVECLHRNLNSSNAFTTITVLQVIEKLGDQRSQRCVERFLTRFPRQANPAPSLTNDVITHAHALSSGSIMPAEAQYRVRLAAEACLAALQERQEQAVANATLLRPSESTQAPHEQLLRSSEHNSHTDPAHMVRPTTQSMEDPAEC